MAQPTNNEIMLELIHTPAFLVENNTIVLSNQKALAAGFTLGLTIQEIFNEDAPDLQHNCVCSGLTFHGVQWDAVVLATEDKYIFRLNRPNLSKQLQSLALLGMQMRYAVGNLSLITSQLTNHPNTETISTAANVELSKMLRLLNNVSNASRLTEDRTCYYQERNICSVLAEFLEECASLLEKAGIQLKFSIPHETIYTMMDWHMLRQAVYNLLNNAVKYSPAGGTVEVSLTRHGSNLQLCVIDHGSGIDPEVMYTLFDRFTRDPNEDGMKGGLGLGLAIVRATASAHGGTVLVDTDANGTRITMTMAIRQPKHLKLHSQPEFVISSPDDGRIMFSNVLPPELYKLQG